MLTGILKELKIEVHLGVTYSDDNKLGYDYALQCSGFSYLGPREFMQDSISECVDKKTGQIWVDLQGRVTNKHPIAQNQKPELL